MYRIIPLIFTVAVALFVSGAVPAAAATHEVAMTNELKYSPYRITVATGDTVQWKNVSLFSHTVTADPAFARHQDSVRLPPGTAPFNSGMIPPKGTFAYTFSQPGTYRYFCIPHEDKGMVGEVIVEPPAAGR